MDKLCPFCNKLFEKFLPGGLKISILVDKKVIGGGFRPNKTCPNCKSKDRERLVYLYLKNKTKLFESDQKIKLLHIAPEKNLQKVLKSNPNIEYVSIDINPLKAMKEMNIINLEFESNSFDAIICIHVLEHINDDKKAMSELFRVLKPSGWAILQVPISKSLEKTYEDFSITTPEMKKIKFGQDDHVRIYGQDYKKRLEEAGFKVNVYNFANDYGAEKATRYAIIPEEDIYFCIKSNL